MPDQFTADESRKLAVVIARIWSNPQLASEYQQNPESVLKSAGISLGGRAVPEIPEKPAELAAQNVVHGHAGSSASSVSTAGCPATGCTASCACCNVAPDLKPHLDAIMKLAAENPEGRKHAREMIAKWNISFPS